MASFMFISFIVFIALPSVLWLYALADVIINEFQYFSTKAAWLVVLCFFPPIGTILYFLVGRSQRLTIKPVGKVVVFIIIMLPALMILGYLLFILGQFTLFPTPPETIRI
ncbi:PLDc N-terminal domain-containing protein [Geobacter pelophilus]|uniref:PLDc N-terminal domain-containing protein n=1 Tax=Geoanaerobacter pelophilus TaxID=60036 RepID=A0AAW4L1W6_9BACT|nr:PLDc N-terminal domain-containing protein [Geoanaerobacter pelophilus]MBT0664709.1 PLDc N-terminal domain-containing protein [Geoanaerobacter pelophilus]